MVYCLASSVLLLGFVVLKVGNHLLTDYFFALLELFGLGFGRLSIILSSFQKSKMNISAIVEPNFSICIFEEFSSHLQNFSPINFLNIVAEFKALLICLLLVTSRPHILNLLSLTRLYHHGLIINFSYWILLIDWCIKLQIYWLTTPSLSFNTGLNDLDSLPVFLVWPPLKLFTKLIFPEDLDLLGFFVPNHGPFGIPRGFPVVSSSYIRDDRHRALCAVFVYLILSLFLFYLATKELFHVRQAKIA